MTRLAEPDARQTTLHEALHETFRLYQATHLAHWNVRGPHFAALHTMFEEQYNDAWTALDVLAERLRATGQMVPLDALTNDAPALPEDAMAMVRFVAEKHRTLSAHLRDLEQAAEAADDTATADLAVERMRAHDQFAWMLEATAQ